MVQPFLFCQALDGDLSVEGTGHMQTTCQSTPHTAQQSRPARSMRARALYTVQPLALNKRRIPLHSTALAFLPLPAASHSSNHEKTDVASAIRDLPPDIPVPDAASCRNRGPAATSPTSPRSGSAKLCVDSCAEAESRNSGHGIAAKLRL